MNINTLAMIESPQNIINNDQWQQLTDLLERLEPNQKLWLSGYLAASAYSTSHTENKPNGIPSAEKSNTKQLTILYGSQTGNGESIAKQLKSTAEAAGLMTEVYSLADFSVKQLAKKQLITLVISTHGEGEAPDDAENFYQQLFSKKAPELKELRFSVLALGDSSYELFCQTGKEIDQRLKDLGAKAMHNRVDCDVDFEQDAGQWVDDLLPKIKQHFKQHPEDTDNITALPIASNKLPALASKSKPFIAEILTIQKITGRGSDKNTFHIELATDPSIIQYQPGDSLAVIAQNNQQAVQSILNYWKLQGDEIFEFKNQLSSIRELLSEKIEITQISKPFIKFLAEQTANKALLALIDSHEAYKRYCENHQLLDLLRAFDPQRSVNIQSALNQLRAITPRLYSIASAQSIYEDEVHLTIDLANPTDAGHYGLASGLLCNTAEIGDFVAVYVEPNKHFKLPENPATAIILIGPGTGVAPFRSFLQQRKAQQASGKNWLIFGNPYFESDFLYQTEWLKLQQQGVLNEIDVAFSRDQAHKVYVQDKLKSKAEKVWQWLENGACLYLCGDANRMAKDVEQSLIDIISQQGKMSVIDATNHLKNLKKAHKYQKDVY